jgi:hypothetical protein
MGDVSARLNAACSAAGVLALLQLEEIYEPPGRDYRNALDHVHVA